MMHRITSAKWFFLSAGLALFLSAGPPGAAEEREVVTLETPDFLKAPAGVAVEGFAIAKTAPRVDVTVVTGLPDGGKGSLWSSWGDGCIARSGKYYTSIGNHL